MRLKRFGAFLLAMFYLSFAGGIEFLHHHSDGVLPDVGQRASYARFSFPRLPDLGKTVPTAADTDCAACNWDKNCHFTSPSVTVPPVIPSLEIAYASPIPALDSPELPHNSSRGPPLS
jgi:hypothetical protein